MKGACNCKKIQFEIKDKPLNEVLSYESDRQMQSGADSVFDLWVKRAQFQLTQGELKTHTHQGCTHAFCEHCGATVYVEKQGEEHMAIPANALENHDKLYPKMSVFTKDAPAWALIPGNMPAFEGKPDTKEYKRKTRLKYFVVYPIVLGITAIFFTYVLLKMGG